MVITREACPIHVHRRCRCQLDPCGAVRLSEREERVLKLRTTGFEIKEIGSIMDMGRKCVEGDLHRIKRKTGIYSDTMLVHYAISRGLIDLEHPEVHPNWLAMDS